MKSLLGWILFIICVAGAIYAIPRLLTYTMGTSNPTLVVISRSMYPVLNRGDLILVKSTTLEEIDIGTVIVFHHKDGLTVHRVVRMNGDIITTKGDANPTEDNPITYADVVGRVPNIGNTLLKIPYIGRVSLITQPEASGVEAETNPIQQIARYIWNPVGFCLLVLLPAVLFMGSISRDIISAISPARNRIRRRKKYLERLKKRFPKARLA